MGIWIVVIKVPVTSVFHKYLTDPLNTYFEHPTFWKFVF